ncbi:MAG: dTDP-4-dehydrorhamnose reductase [Alphaproteobacteria bacterium MarineAlpha2_Bin1]|nr:MAG: dTDP-4-dehydrorhamnose reductase [Alphaproteobacteria bacterium MarineAlpha2_Bin1]|tara:strand:- start:750 stop:1649 length:900 start_codon:yes stop_codon:yes gene_type:complete
MEDLRIVIFGASGHIGHELFKIFSKSNTVLAPSRLDLDLRVFNDIGTYLRIAKPNLIINAASFSDIDLAENKILEVKKLNTDLPEYLAIEALNKKIGLVHFSSDQIFDGRGQRNPYNEEDMPNPLNVYGRSILRGESMIKNIFDNYLIFRSSRIYSLRKPCFISKLLSVLREHKDINVSSDQFGSPTWARSLAMMAYDAIMKSDILNNTTSEKLGVYHLSDEGEVSWFDFANAIIEIIGRKKSSYLKEKPIIRAIDSDLLLSPTKQPRYSALSTSKAEKILSVRPVFWRNQLESCLSEI